MTLPLRQDSSSRQHVDKINELISYRLNAEGSVSRTRQSKDEERVSVLDFVEASATDHTSGFIAAIASLSEGSTLDIPYGNYYITEKITAILPRGVTINCYGTLNFTALSECLEITALNAQININKISCSNSCGTALIIKSCMRSNFDIREIAGGSNITDAGIKIVGRYATLDGDGISLNGCIYNEIRARTISVNTSTANGITITTEQNGAGGYVNECEIYPQWIDANNGVKFIKGTGQTDRFNSNKIMFAGFENITTDGLYMEYTIRNVIHSPRFEVVGQYEVYEDADTYQNTYFITYSNFWAKWSMNGYSARVVGNGREPTGGVIYREAIQDVTGEWVYWADAYNAAMENNTIFFKRNDQGQGIFDYWTFGVKDSSGVLRNSALLDPLGSQQIVSVTGDQTIQDGISLLHVATNGGNVSLVMPSIKETDGYFMMMNVYFYSNTLEIKKNNGSVAIAAGQITGQGLYVLTYKVDTWFVSYIGNPISTAPGSYEGYITWDPGSLIDGAGETSTDITVSSAAINDGVTVIPPYSTQGIKYWGWVDSAGNVKIRLENNTGTTIDLASGSWKVRIIKR